MTFRESSDYETFLFFLRLASSRYRLQIHAYALMTNHVHLMVTPTEIEELSRAVQSLGRRYVRYFNDRYERTGTLWEGRFRTALVNDERYWLACMRYVEMNPVRAGLVTAPEQYEWSSYRAHAFGRIDRLLSPHPVYENLARTPEGRQEHWRRLCGAALSPEELQAARDSVRIGVFGVVPVRRAVERGESDQSHTTTSPESGSGDVATQGS